MSVVDYLHKKDKIKKSMIKVLSDLYGAPQWLTKPKDGQEAETVFNEWVDEFGDYDEYDLKQACRRHYRWNKGKTFPTISHIAAQLTETNTIFQKSTPKGLIFFCIEADLQKADLDMGNKWVSPYHYRRAVSYLLTEVLKNEIGNYEYYEIEKASQTRGELDLPRYNGKRFRRACDLDLFAKHMDELLERSQRGDLPYVQY